MTKTCEEQELEGQIRYHAEEIAYWTEAERVVILVFSKEGIQEEVIVEREGSKVVQRKRKEVEYENVTAVG